MLSNQSQLQYCTNNKMLISKSKFIKIPLSKATRIAQFNPQQKITFPNLQNLIDKLIRLRQDHHNFDVVADFDHTLTQHRLGDQKCDSLFGMWVTNQNLCPNFRSELMQNYKFYGPFETDPTLSFSQKFQYVDKLYNVQRWLFQKHNITNKHATDVLDNSQLVYRAQIRELIETLHEMNTTLHIVSGGISDLIYSSLVSVVGKQMTNEVIRIHSNAWQIYKQEQNTHFLRFLPRSVHSYNKHLIMREFPVKKRNCMLLGDLKSDIYMAYGAGYETIISVFYGKAGQFDQRALAESKFDVIVEEDSSHKIVIELLKIVSGNRNVDWPYLYRINPILTNLII